MTTPDFDQDTEAVHIPVQPQPPPVSPQPVGPVPPAASGDASVRRTTVRRRPVPRGTVALGATAAGALVVTSAAVLLPPVAAVAAAAAAVVVPASVAMRRARSGNRRRGGRGLGRGNRGGGLGRSRNGRLFGGNGGKLFGGGGGRMGNPLRGIGRSGGTGGGGRGGGRTPTGARSGGLPSGRHRGGGGGRMGNPLRGIGRGGTAGGRAGRGSPKIPGTGRGRGGGRGGSTGSPPGGRGGVPPRLKGLYGKLRGRGRSLPGGRSGRGSPKIRGAEEGRGGSLPGGRSSTLLGGSPRSRRRLGLGRGLGDDLRNTRRDLADVGRAVKAGVRTGGRPRDAARAAWARAGQGRPRAFSGRLARVMIGALGLCGAMAARGAVNGARRVRKMYEPKQTQPAPVQAPTAPRQQNQHQQHPVPAPRRRPSPGPASTPTAPVGATPGGTQMSGFPPRDAAVDFYGACVKYSPGTHSGALFDLQWVLPQMAEASWLIANGWHMLVKNVERDLQGGIKPEMLQVLSEIYRLLCKAAELSQDLPANFAKIHADELRRTQIRGAHTANVPVR